MWWLLMTQVIDHIRPDHSRPITKTHTSTLKSIEIAAEHIIKTLYKSNIFTYPRPPHVESEIIWGNRWEKTPWCGPESGLVLAPSSLLPQADVNYWCGPASGLVLATSSLLPWADLNFDFCPNYLYRTTADLFLDCGDYLWLIIDEDWAGLMVTDDWWSMTTDCCWRLAVMMAVERWRLAKLMSTTGQVCCVVMADDWWCCDGWWLMTISKNWWVTVNDG